MASPHRKRAVLATAIVLAWTATAVQAQQASEPQQTPEPTLKASPEIVPPAPPPPRTPAAVAAPVPQLPGETANSIAGTDNSRSTAGTQTLPADNGAIFLRADRIEGTGESIVEAFGRVELRTRAQTVLAEHLLYNFTDNTISANGNVLLRKGNDWISGPSFTLRRNDSTGYFESPKFFIGEVNGRGDASRIEFAGPNKYVVTDGRYTTCAAPRNDWYVQTRRLELDRTTNEGVARDATVQFFDTPIFYSPYLSFPLSDERKSGFLTPTAGSSTSTGFEFSAPYYLNLAPNYDATITPRLMTKRGLQMGGQFRYLFGDPNPMAGEVDVEVLPDDRVTDSTRYLLEWRHTEQFTPWLTGIVNVTKVSDDTYFSDLSDRIAVTSQSTLPRQAALTANYGPFSMTAQVLSFQTLQDPASPIVPPYNMLPQLLGTMADTELFGLNFSGAAEYAQFRNSQLQQGNRAVLYPQVAWSRQGSSWFFTARGSVHMDWYDLQPPPGLAPGQSYSSSPSVVVPIASVDTGLIFERNWTIFGHDFINTLEPRAFYVYVPYRNQNALPVFDTALDDFNFSQLFTENRYVGNDRVGDANQLTLAVSSRLLDPVTGAERLRVSVGQRLYFTDQLVTLPSELPRSGSSSDILFQADGKLSDAWALSALVEQNLGTGQNEQLNMGMRYTPEPGKVFNAVYRYNAQLTDSSGLPEPLKQFDLSGEWPVSPNWTLLGRWNYSIPDHQTLEAIAGFEYNQDCWVLRVVYHRFVTTTEQTSNSVFVQLELNGLGRVGTSPLDLLRRSVPGYLRTNDPTLMRRDTQFDPLPDF
jgi:LPS-assembly protein